jgi:hypothetical protein
LYLGGIFAPVDDELDLAELSVIGKIPQDLRGVYFRNGPNVKFPPLRSYTYPLDGDGMIHGVWLDNGRARYRNRYVMTKGLKAEIHAGHALWGGVMTPSRPPASLVGADPDPEDDKLLPGINIVRHAPRLLALGEGTAPYEMTDELATVGRCDFAGSLPLGMCAHPKIDPASGEMILFRYGLEEPYLYWAAVGPDGRVTRPPTVIAEIDRGYMIHDFLITEDYLVLIINPATFDFARAGRGASPVAWEPDRGTLSPLSLAAGRRTMFAGSRPKPSGAGTMQMPGRRGTRSSPSSPGGAISVSEFQVRLRRTAMSRVHALIRRQEPDVRISRIRLSDWFRPQAHDKAFNRSRVSGNQRLRLARAPSDGS